jgi:hypothetical protein
MPYCIACRQNVCRPCRPLSGVPLESRRVMVASDSQLSRKSHVQRLAMAARALELPRRAIPDWIADQIYGFEGAILWPDGRAFELSDTAIDDAFNDDGSFRWLSDFLRFAETEPRQRPQARVLDRLRLIDLAFRIAKPEQARLIGR